MDENYFSGTAQVEIQGPRVLRFIELTKDEAKFEIIGLSKPKIQVIDKRSTVCKSMAEIIITGKVENLVQHFNTPAKITIYPTNDGKLTISLEKTQDKNPKHMFWVAIGIQAENVPIYQYINLQIEHLDEKKYALVSLYKRPPH